MADTTTITTTTTTTDTRPKRSKPCECCRTHRRKCILANANVCERCQRLAIPCYFKFSQKPALPPKKKKPSTSATTLSAAKKTLMIQQVQQLEQWADALAADLDDLNTNHRSHPWERQRRPWQVCIQRLHAQHLIMDTNIASISDLLAWMQQQQQQLQQAPAWPLSGSNNNMALVVTLGPMPVEKALRDMFTSTNNHPQQQPHGMISSTPPIQQLNSIKRQLIDIYFTCQHLHNPLLVAPYYHPYMHQHMDDMISWAAAAYVAYSYRSCHHVQQAFPDRQDLLMEIGEVCRFQAKHLLDQALFLLDDDLDDDDDCSGGGGGGVSWIFTAYLLTHLALMTLQPKEARRYADACWRMAIEQKETHVRHLSGISTTGGGDPALLRLVYAAESWRRLYMAARFLDICLNLIHDQVINVAQLASHAVAIGFPRPLLPMEASQCDAIVAFGQLCQLYHVAFMGNGERLSDLAFRLYLGKLASVRSQDAAAMEARYVAFWYTLPVTARVGSTPLDYITEARIQQCAPRAIRVNITYYLGIMSTALRIMPDPTQVDLVGVSLNNISNNAYDQGRARAVLVVSVCCDAIIQMYHGLSVRLPCTVELHWVSIVLDTVLLLVHAKHPEVRRRAQQGARIAKALFRQCIASSSSSSPTTTTATTTTHHADTPESTCTNSTTSSSSTTTTTTLIRSPSPTATSPPSSSKLSSTTYRVLLAQEMDAQLASKDDSFYL